MWIDIWLGNLWVTHSYIWKFLKIFSSKRKWTPCKSLAILRRLNCQSGGIYQPSLALSQLSFQKGQVMQKTIFCVNSQPLTSTTMSLVTTKVWNVTCIQALSPLLFVFSEHSYNVHSEKKKVQNFMKRASLSSPVHMGVDQSCLGFVPQLVSHRAFQQWGKSEFT